MTDATNRHFMQVIFDEFPRDIEPSGRKVPLLITLGGGGGVYNLKKIRDVL